MNRRFGLQVVLASAFLLAACSEEPAPHKPPPEPPVAHIKIVDPATGPYEIGQRIVVDGRESKGEGELEYRWTLRVPEGSQAAFEFENRDRNAFTPDAGGTYVVELVVVDRNGESAPATVEVLVTYGAPVAVLELRAPDPVVALEDEVIADGSKSHDPAGRPLAYEFRFTARPEGSRAQIIAQGDQARFIPDRGGTYEVGLRVRNDTTWSEEVRRSIQVQPPRNKPPVAEAGEEMTVEVGRVANLDGSKSSDPNGDALTYEWTFLETPEGSEAVIEDANQAKARFVPDLEGDYLVQLRVFDGEFEATDTVVVHARPAVNFPPKINWVRLDGIDLLPGRNVTRPFGQTAVIEVDVLDDVPSSVSVNWVLAGPVGSTAELVDAGRFKRELLPDREGLYEITIVATDGQLESEPFSFGIRFRDVANNLPPVAILDVPGGMTLPDGAISFENGTRITLDGSGSFDQDNPPDEIVNYHWVLEAKPDGDTRSVNQSGIEPSTSFLLTHKARKGAERYYRFRLVVKDSLQAESAPDLVEIESRNRAPVARTNTPAPTRLSRVHVDRLANGLPSDVILNAFSPALESYDLDPGDNENLTVLWELVSAPGGATVVIQYPDADWTYFYADTVGTYVVKLTVFDNDPVDPLSSETTVTVEITD